MVSTPRPDDDGELNVPEAPTLVVTVALLLRSRMPRLTCPAPSAARLPTMAVKAGEAPALTPTRLIA